MVGERDGGLALDIACVDQVMEQIKPSTGGPPKYSVCRRSSSHSITLTNINSPRIPRTMERNRRVRKLAATPIQFGLGWRYLHGELTDPRPLCGEFGLCASALLGIALPSRATGLPLR